MKLDILILSLITIFNGFQLLSQGREWQDPEINQINRLPMHTHYFAYSNVEEAIIGQKEKSKNFISLNGKWKFNFVKDASLRPVEFYDKDYYDGDWGSINVPGVWELNGYGDPLYKNAGYAWANQFQSDPPKVPTENNHVGSYRKVIDIPVSWKGKRIFAHFGAVTSNIYLWINGKFAGYSEDSRLEAEFDITAFVKPGRNLIAFQVFRWCDGTYLEDQDFFRYSGVSRDCYLYARNSEYIRDIIVTPDLDTDYINGKLKVELFFSAGTSHNLTEFILFDANRNTVASETAREGSDLITLSVANPKKWSAEIPYLYTLLAILRDKKGEILEVIPQKVGFRKIEIRNAQLLVNGKPVLIKGANRHELDPSTGSYVSKQRMLEDVTLLKKFNFNAVRTSHYPCDSYFYELCDEYGIYLVAEANLESHGMGYDERTLAIRKDFFLAHLERNQRNVQRNRNHPSVIIWSLGNEAGREGDNLQACYDWIKANDSRPVQYECNGLGLGIMNDIYCPMYPRYQMMEEYGQSDPETEGVLFPSQFEMLEKYRQSDSNRPLIACEYGHFKGNSGGGFKEYWDLIRKYPKIQGGFIWDFADKSPWWNKNGIEIYAYGGDFNPYDTHDGNWCNNGLFNPDRLPNPHAWEVKYVMQPIWTSPGDLNKGIVNVYNEYFFRDLGNYCLEWQLLFEGRPVQTGTVQEMHVGPQKLGTVKLGYNLDGFSGGKEILLNVLYKTKNAEPLIPAGFIIAKQQFVITPYSFAGFDIDNEPAVLNSSSELPEIITNDANFLIIRSDECRIDFRRNTGFIERYEIDGIKMLKKGGNLRPNFWRAMTDADRSRLNSVWHNPGIRLEKMESHMRDGFVEIVTKYTLQNVSAELFLVYRINNQGAMKITERIKTGNDVNIPVLPRFGMQMQMPAEFEKIEYYGRGPVENYIDRNNSQFLGIYNQTVEGQFYPYIKPQETGNKADVRWWKLTNKDGNGLLFEAEMPFSISALHHSIEALQSSGHSPDLPNEAITSICIDKAQMGLGCVNTWGAWPLEEYLLQYQDYEFNFSITPISQVK